MDVKSVLLSCDVTDAHFQAIAEAIPEGYQALCKLADTTPMLGQFVQGLHGLSYLRNVAVQHALAAKAAETELFFTSDGWNASRNHTFLRLQVKQVVFTPHYCGKTGERAVRKAVARAALTERNYDLFEADGHAPDFSSENKSAYAQIVHAGVRKPVFGAILIPDRNQRSFKLGALPLDLQPPKLGAVEEVQDRLNEAFKSREKEQKNVG